MASPAPTTRRTLFAIAAGAALTGTSLTASANDNPALTLAKREAAAVSAMGKAVNEKVGATDAEWDAWSQRETRFVAWAESLPLTPENAQIKAVAFATIYDYDLNDFIDHQNDAADHRLALQIIKTLLGRTH